MGSTDIGDLLGEHETIALSAPSRIDENADLERAGSLGLGPGGLIVGGIAGGSVGVGVVFTLNWESWQYAIAVPAALAFGLAGAVLAGVLLGGFLANVDILLTALLSLFRRTPKLPSETTSRTSADLLPPPQLSRSTLTEESTDAIRPPS